MNELKIRLIKFLIRTFNIVITCDQAYQLNLKYVTYIYDTQTNKKYFIFVDEKNEYKVRK
jgi:hypothetical protein